VKPSQIFMLKDSLSVNICHPNLQFYHVVIVIVCWDIDFLSVILTF
jgi:hypothetical protein